jgi:hypothetical protein
MKICCSGKILYTVRFKIYILIFLFVLVVLGFEFRASDNDPSIYASHVTVISYVPLHLACSLK